MRVLFRDQYDSTLFVAEISFVNYYTEYHELQLFSIDDDEITIPNITEETANSIVKTLFEEGKIDLSEYNAFLNEEPPDTPDKEHFR